MASFDLLGPFKGIGGGMFTNLTAILPIMIYSILGAFIVMLLIKVMTHRLRVEKLSPVQGGYALKSGRYREMFDKKTKLKYLKPMMGREKLPAFPSNCYQKVNSWPFFGALRQISLIFPNKYSPAAILPTANYETNGQIVESNLKRFYYMLERERFLKQFKNDNLVYLLSLYAPLVIILGALAFWVIMIYLQNGMYQTLGDEIQQTTAQLQAVLK